MRGQICDPAGSGRRPVTAQVAPLLEPIRARLPAGTTSDRWRGGGRAPGQSSVCRLPLFFAVVFTMLMVNWSSFSRTTMVVVLTLLRADQGVMFLLLFNKPFGFVAVLGTIALFGMIMRSSVILVDQIEAGWRRASACQEEVIVESAVRRRPSR